MLVSRWARHTSITVRGNRFYDWKAEAGGYPIEIGQRYFNYNFKQAVEFLLSNVGDLQMSVPYEKTEKAELKTPTKKGNPSLVISHSQTLKPIVRDINFIFFKVVAIGVL